MSLNPTRREVLVGAAAVATVTTLAVLPEEARKLGLKVVPQCWFFREYIDRNSEFADLLH